jgi:hypothetical protein
MGEAFAADLSKLKQHFGPARGSGVISNSQLHFCNKRGADGAHRRKLANRSSGDFWQRVPLELLDAFAWLTDRSGSRSIVRIKSLRRAVLQNRGSQSYRESQIAFESPLLSPDRRLPNTRIESNIEMSGLARFGGGKMRGAKSHISGTD